MISDKEKEKENKKEKEIEKDLIIGDIFKIYFDRKIGSGSFGEIFEGINIIFII
jgi:hypothetical protein